MAPPKQGILLIEKPEIREVYFVSDLHIYTVLDRAYEFLLQMIDHVASRPEAFLVLGGDIFHVAVGSSRYFEKKYQRVFSQLKQIKNSWVYMAGNHDFHLGKMIQKYGGKYLDRPFLLQVEAKRFYFAHGDEVDLQDKAYLRLRKFLHSPLAKTLIALSPGLLLERMGLFFGSLSHDARQARKACSKSDPCPCSTGRSKEYFLQLFHDFAQQMHQKWQVDACFLGHCHIEMLEKLGSVWILNPGFPYEPGQEFKALAYRSCKFSFFQP